jgi:hypothetical protein
MATKMPTSHFIDNLPSATRRRFINATEQNNIVKVPKRTAIALGTTGYKRSAWNSSSSENQAISPHRPYLKASESSTEAPPGNLSINNTSSDGENVLTTGKCLTTVVEVNKDHLTSH